MERVAHATVNAALPGGATTDLVRRMARAAITALSTPPPVSGMDRAVHLGQAGALAMLAEELERAGEMRAADLADRTAKFYRQWADDPAVVPPYVEDLPHRDDQPVSGTATRDDVRERFVDVVIDHMPDETGHGVSCVCGWRHYEHPEQSLWARHVADELMALGVGQPAAQPDDAVAAAREWLWRHSSQPDGDRWTDDPDHLDWAAQNLVKADLAPFLAAQPAQHHDDDRPITQYTEQGDEGLRARVEALLTSHTDRYRESFVSVADLRLALDGDGGDRG